MQRKSIIPIIAIFLPLLAISCSLLPVRMIPEPTEDSRTPSFPPAPPSAERMDTGARPESDTGIEGGEYRNLFRFPDDDPGEGGPPPSDISLTNIEEPPAVVPAAIITKAPEPTDEEIRERRLLDLLKAATAKPGGVLLIEAIAQIAQDKPEAAYKILNGNYKGDNKMLVEFLQAYLDYRLGNNADSLKEIESVARKMRHEMPLRISTLELCRKVESYAKFESFSERVFKPGEITLIYCEPEQFRCTSSEDAYLTSLNVRYFIVNTATGDSAWKIEYTIDHTTTKYLYDLFLLQRVTIPDVPDGNYELRVEVQDKQSSYTHIAKKSLTFDVRANR